GSRSNRCKMVGRVFPLSLPGLTRQSIFFVMRSCEADGPAGHARGMGERRAYTNGNPFSVPVPTWRHVLGRSCPCPSPNCSELGRQVEYPMLSLSLDVASSLRSA